MKNDGPGFSARIVAREGSQGQQTSLDLELPTGTLKRVTLPVYTPRGGYSSWNVLLYDSKGNVVAEQPNLRPRQHLHRSIPVLAALPRSFTGTPVVKQTKVQNNAQLQPGVARIPPQLLPENAITLEGLGCFYLNSERAGELTRGQVEALTSWLRNGGHLIVAVEQPQDIANTPWLRDLMPVKLGSTQTLTNHSALHEWISGTWSTGAYSYAVQQTARPSRSQGSQDKRSTPPYEAVQPFKDLARDERFESAELRVSSAEPGAHGRVEVSQDGTPLIVVGEAGLGKVTTLLFSPEREPARSWEHAQVMWARLVEIPGDYYMSSDFYAYGGWSVDNVFGAMLDTRQTKKLPLGALLLMLFAYLIVTGPADYFILRKLGKLTLTWITFPTYVIGFALLVYLVGFKLRAGDLEWNELHVVDAQDASGREQILSGRSYATLYSPSTRQYTIRGPNARAVFRGEQGMWYGTSGTKGLFVSLRGETFMARAEVPVWLSHLFVSRWDVRAQPPFRMKVVRTGNGLELHCDNRSSAKFAVACVVSNKLVQVGELRGGAQVFAVKPEKGRDLPGERSANLSRIQNALQSRQMSFRTGSNYERLDDWPFITQLLSFPESGRAHQQTHMSLQSDSGLELSAVLDRPDTVVVFLAGDGKPPAEFQREFQPRRSKRMTVWRVVLKIGDEPN